MTDPSSPNFTSGVGRLVTDRFDFQSHIDGTGFRQSAKTIDLLPNLDGYANVQDALTAIFDSFSPPDIPSASPTTKGIIKLAGDLGGTADIPKVIGINGFSVSTGSIPVEGDVLTYFSGLWTPRSLSSVFTPGGDLTGGGTIQHVVSLTGNTSSLLTAHNLIIAYDDVSTSPLITQYSRPSNAADFIIRAQSPVSGGPANFKGGDVILGGGRKLGSGKRGGVKLQYTEALGPNFPSSDLVSSPSSTDATGANMIQVGESASDSRVIALCRPTDIDSTDMPVGSGDLVVYLGNAATAPTPGVVPLNGCILFSQNGHIYIQEGDGTQIQLAAPLTNPFTWGTAGENVFQQRFIDQTTTGTIATHQFTIGSGYTAIVDAFILGKQSGSNNTDGYHLTATFTRKDSGTDIVQVGGTTVVSSHLSAGTTGWTHPTITFSAPDKMIVSTGANASTTIGWMTVVKIITVSQG